MAKHYGKKYLSRLHRELISSNSFKGVVCDGCNAAEFSDIRYKCAVCPDYDLCKACYNGKKETSKHLQSHAMIGIEPSTMKNESLLTNKHRDQMANLEVMHLSSM
jgi:hypothetical protein